MNRATTKGIKRSRTSAWCCGHNYQRWRFPSGRYPNNKTHCPDCGRPLIFRKIKNPTLDRYFRNRAKNLADGRTCHGTAPRRTNFNIPTPLEKAWRAFRAAADGARLAATREISLRGELSTIP